MKAAVITFLFLLTSYYTFAQADSSTRNPVLSEVIISGIQDATPKQTSLNLASYKLAELENKTPLNLSDALSNIPGVGQVTTGNAISKPVIRGLYGNRILVLLSGLRFDNQQWQDEHGLGLSQIGIDRVELIRGPASILYGSDAVGGVINIIEHKPVRYGDRLDINLRGFSNTEGTLTDIGYEHKRKTNWWYLRGGYENHADYSDGNNNRVLNSRNKGYYGKAGLGFTYKNWQQENSYNFSYNQYGFILDHLNQFFDADSRWARSLPGPHHIVILNTFSSQNTFRLHSSTLKVNAGVQSNKRKEDEGGGSISLNMHLLSLLENMKWEKQLTDKLLFVTNQQFTYERNTNLGKRILVPDANMYEGNLSGFLRFTLERLYIEAGAGASYKYIQTFSSGRLNNSSSEIQPFNIGRPTATGLIGFSYNPNRHVNLKYNISSGFRAGNLAELSSNGLHEGTYRYEIGDPDLELEQSFNNDISFEISESKWQLGASVYLNKMLNYIYLAPTNDSFVGFQIYRYKQQGAKIYGGELVASYSPVKTLEFKESFAITRGVLNDGGNLPFVPANKSTTSLIFKKSFTEGIQQVRVEPNVEYYFAQNNPAMFELPTPDYMLVNIYSKATVRINNHDYDIGLACKNLLNKPYTNHLSRIRYYGLLNQGINIIFSINTTLDIR